MIVSAYLKGSFQVQISVIVIVSDKLDKNWENKLMKSMYKKTWRWEGLNRIVHFGSKPPYSGW